MEDERLIRKGEAAVAHYHRSCEEARKHILPMARGLLAAKQRYPATQDFGDWLKGSPYRLINKNDRAALINIAEHESKATEFLKSTDLSSPELIWAAIQAEQAATSDDRNSTDESEREPTPRTVRVNVEHLEPETRSVRANVERLEPETRSVTITGTSALPTLGAMSKLSTKDDDDRFEPASIDNVVRGFAASARRQHAKAISPEEDAKDIAARYPKPSDLWKLIKALTAIHRRRTRKVKPNALEKELVAAVRIMQFPDEERQNYLARLCRLSTELPKYKWKALSRGSQLWSSDAADAVTDGNDVPEPAKYLHSEAENDEVETRKVKPKTRQTRKVKPKTRRTRRHAT